MSKTNPCCCSDSLNISSPEICYSSPDKSNSCSRTSGSTNNTCNQDTTTCSTKNTSSSSCCQHPNNKSKMSPCCSSPVNNCQSPCQEIKCSSISSSSYTNPSFYLNLLQSKEEVVRWEEGKKWQQTTEKLKQKLQASCQEMEKLQATNKLLRDQVTRSDKERCQVENKMKNLQKTVEDDTCSENLEQLKKRNLCLEKELGRLKASMDTDPNNRLKELEVRSNLLEDQCQTLQRELTNYEMKKGALRKCTMTAEMFDDYQRVKLKQKQLQDQMKNVQTDKSLLKLKTEHNSLTIQHLEQTICALETENKALQTQIRNTYANLKDKRLTSPARLTGETTRMTELEESISCLKQLVDKLQLENELLKKSARKMKSQVSAPELEPSKDMDKSSFSKHFVSKDSASAAKVSQCNKDSIINKALAENERLQQQIKKVQSSKDQLSYRVRNQKSEIKRLNDELDRTYMSLEKAKRSSTTLISETELKSSRGSHSRTEERCKELEKELKQTKSKLDEANSQLIQAACREEKLIHGEYQESIEDLRDLVSKSGSMTSAEKYESMMKENALLKVEVRSKKSECEKGQTDLRRSSAEFEVIKKKYKSVVDRNSSLEKEVASSTSKLAGLASLVGIDVEKVVKM